MEDTKDTEQKKIKYVDLGSPDTRNMAGKIDLIDDIKSLADDPEDQKAIADAVASGALEIKPDPEAKAMLKKFFWSHVHEPDDKAYNKVKRELVKFMKQNPHSNGYIRNVLRQAPELEEEILTKLYGPDNDEGVEVIENSLEAEDAPKEKNELAKLIAERRY